MGIARHQNCHAQLLSIRELARTEKHCILHTAKLLPLAYLAPDLVETSRAFAERVMQGHEAYRVSSERDAVALAPRDQ